MKMMTAQNLLLALMYSGFHLTGGTVPLTIEGGNTVRRGDNVSLLCNCWQASHRDATCGLYPVFEINGQEHRVGSLQSNPKFSLIYDFTLNLFRLTVWSVRRRQSGTTFRCGVVDHYDAVVEWSNTVTIFVEDGDSPVLSAALGTSRIPALSDTYSTAATPIPTSLSTEPKGSPDTPPEILPVNAKEEDAPTYVYVAVGSAVGIIMYILTIVLIGLLIWLKIKGKKTEERKRHHNSPMYEPPMVTNPVYSDMMTPSSPAPPYFKDDPCMFGGRQVIVHMDSRYHNVPQRKSVAAESLYDYIDMQ
jgi:hypothetical protein